MVFVPRLKGVGWVVGVFRVGMRRPVCEPELAESLLLLGASGGAFLFRGEDWRRVRACPGQVVSLAQRRLFGGMTRTLAGLYLEEVTQRCAQGGGASLLAHFGGLNPTASSTQLTAVMNKLFKGSLEQASECFADVFGALVTADPDLPDGWKPECLVQCGAFCVKLSLSASTFARWTANSKRR